MVEKSLGPQSLPQNETGTQEMTTYERYAQYHGWEGTLSEFHKYLSESSMKNDSNIFFSPEGARKPESIETMKASDLLHTKVFDCGALAIARFNSSSYVQFLDKEPSFIVVYYLFLPSSINLVYKIEKTEPFPDIE